MDALILVHHFRLLLLCLIEMVHFSAWVRYSPTFVVPSKRCHLLIGQKDPRILGVLELHDERGSRMDFVFSFSFHRLSLHCTCIISRC